MATSADVPTGFTARTSELLLKSDRGRITKTILSSGAEATIRTEKRVTSGFTKNTTKEEI